MDLLHVRQALSRTSIAAADGLKSSTLLPRRVLRPLAICMVLIIFIIVARVTPPLEGSRAVAAWLATLVFGIAFPLAILRGLPTWALASGVALCGLCGVTMAALHLVSLGLLMAVVALSLASRLGSPLAPVLALLIAVGYETAIVMAAADPTNVLSTGSGLLLAYLALSSFRRLGEEKRRTEELLREVLAGRDAQIRAATLDERAHIAREIHDILAHTLSALAVQLEGTRLLIEQRPADPAARVALERASGLVRDGLDEARRAVGALRGDELPGPEALPRLAADFERDTGIPCRLSVEGTPIALSPEAQLALYRTAQEALTNVRKHAADASVVIRLRYAANEAELTVENEGRTHPESATGGGHGLEGMRERAELAHGRLEARPTPTGFRVHLWLPT
jgi:signal transduction histidine kinase